MNTIIIDGLAFSLPLFIMAVGGIYSEKSGVTNLALEGLQGFGALSAHWLRFSRRKKCREAPHFRFILP